MHSNLPLGQTAPLTRLRRNPAMSGFSIKDMLTPIAVSTLVGLEIQDGVERSC